MTAIGLTGGIGSGKSTVGALLTARGAVVIEADAIVHALQKRGQSVFEAIVERFGQSVVGPSGELDRRALADVVFADGDARRDLEGLTHPAVLTELGRRRAEAEARGDVAVLDVPLLAEAGPDAKTRWALDGVVVVDCPVDLAVSRLVESRGMTPREARARIDAQASREQRLAGADFVVDNSGDLAQLEAEVDRCWAWVQGLPS